MKILSAVSLLSLVTACASSSPPAPTPAPAVASAPPVAPAAPAPASARAATPDVPPEPRPRPRTALELAPVHEVTTASKVTVTLRQRGSRRGDDCVDEVKFPELGGVGDAAAQTRLNRSLAQALEFTPKLAARLRDRTGDADRCQARGSSHLLRTQDYTLTSSRRPGALGLRFELDERSSDGDGDGEQMQGVCRVADLGRGELVELHTLLTPGAPAKLGALLTAQLTREGPGRTTGDGVTTGGPVLLGDSPDICLRDAGFGVMVPAGAGSRELPVSAAEMRPLLRPTPLTEALLR